MNFSFVYFVLDFITALKQLCNADETILMPQGGEFNISTCKDIKKFNEFNSKKIIKRKFNYLFKIFLHFL